MKSLFPVSIDRTESGTEPAPLQDRVLLRLMATRFDVASEPGRSFRQAFRDVASDYFTLAADGSLSFEATGIRKETVDALARAFEEAIAVGRIVPFPVRLVATTVLTSLAALHRQVAAGVLAPSEATRLLVTVLCEGVQAPSSAAG